MKQLIKFALLISASLAISMPLFCFADDISTNAVTTPAYAVPTYQTPTINQDTAKGDMQHYAQAGIANYLPIETPQLTPGNVQPKSISNPQLMQPIFLVGSDDRSKNWLEQNRDQLKQLHAIGLLVQANTPDDIQTMQSLGQGLTIIPAPAKVLIEQYGLEHYPVLITKEGITQ